MGFSGTQMVNGSAMLSNNEAKNVSLLLSNSIVELDRVESAISDLQAKRTSLSQSITQYRALLAPIRQLPDDILREIFVQCLPLHRNAAMSAKEAPLQLGRVCSSWRDLSLTTPRLWATMHIVIPQVLSQRDVSLQRDVVKQWVRRSGTVPLDISLLSRRFPPSQFSPFSDDPTVRMLLILIPFMHRWRRIHLQVNPAFLSLLANASYDNLPNLRMLGVSNGADSSPSILLSSLTGLFTAPNLSQVAITALDSNPTNLNLPWSQMTHISFTYSTAGQELTPADALALLERCPNLQKCTLDIFAGDITTQDVTVPASKNLISLPSLHSLDICVSEPIYHVFPLISCPALKRLAYTERLPVNMHIGSASQQAILPIHDLHLSPDCLERVWICVDGPGQPEQWSDRVISYLKEHGVTLRRLQLHVCPSPWGGPWHMDNNGYACTASDILNPLILDTEGEEVCPKLRQLEFFFNSTEFQNVDVLLKVLESRAGKGLEQVRLHFDFVIPFKQEDRLKEFVESHPLLEVTMVLAPRAEYMCESPFEGISPYSSIKRRREF